VTPRPPVSTLRHSAGRLDILAPYPSCQFKLWPGWTKWWCHD